MRRRTSLLALSLGLAVVPWLFPAAAHPQPVRASDHDDGELDGKGRNRNLTDLYVFRERDQDSAISTDDLIFIMNTNPRSVARQQYFFSTNSLYEFHVCRVSTRGAAATGVEDLVLRFTFGAPGTPAANLQAITMTYVDFLNGAAVSETSVSAGETTVARSGIGTPNPAPDNNAVTLAAGFGTFNFTVFAGLREDPFFFDVEQYFRVRAGALGLGPAVGFRAAADAVDFAQGYNVNAIVVRVPVAFLREGGTGDVFDVWETISAPIN